jgi:hypothetical protein
MTKQIKVRVSKFEFPKELNYYITRDAFKYLPDFITLSGEVVEEAHCDRCRVGTGPGWGSCCNWDCSCHKTVPTKEGECACDCHDLNSQTIPAQCHNPSDTCALCHRPEGGEGEIDQWEKEEFFHVFRQDKTGEKVDGYLTMLTDPVNGEPMVKIALPEDVWRYISENFVPKLVTPKEPAVPEPLGFDTDPIAQDVATQDKINEILAYLRSKQ